MRDFVASRRDQVRTIRRTVEGHLAIRAAADGADVFALRGAEPFGLAFFTDRTAHSVSVNQNRIIEGKGLDLPGQAAAAVDAREVISLAVRIAGNAMSRLRSGCHVRRDVTTSRHDVAPR